MKKRKKVRPKRPARRPLPPEDRRAEAVTVAWMLCVLVTLIAEVLGAGGRLVLSGIGPGNEMPKTASALPGAMLFSALVTGTISLLLIPVVYRLRRAPPPPVVTVFSVTVAVVPFVIAWLLAQG